MRAFTVLVAGLGAVAAAQDSNGDDQSNSISSIESSIHSKVTKAAASISSDVAAAATSEHMNPSQLASYNSVQYSIATAAQVSMSERSRLQGAVSKTFATGRPKQHHRRRGVDHLLRAIASQRVDCVAVERDRYGYWRAKVFAFGGPHFRECCGGDGD